MVDKKEDSVQFTRNFIEQTRDEDMFLLTTVQQQVKGVLAEVQYIAEILQTHKTVKPVENIREKIQAAYQKIKQYLDPDYSPEQAESLERSRRSSGISLEANPLIEDMGGLPLESISAEWQQLTDEKLLDKAELENLINKKLKDRVELANKLKAKHKLSAQPRQRPGNQITPKFKKIQQTVKFILKEMPPPPTPTPRFEPNKPRPY